MLIPLAVGQQTELGIVQKEREVGKFYRTFLQRRCGSVNKQGPVALAHRGTKIRHQLLRKKKLLLQGQPARRQETKLQSVF